MLSVRSIVFSAAAVVAAVGTTISDTYCFRDEDKNRYCLNCYLGHQEPFLQHMTEQACRVSSFHGTFHRYLSWNKTFIGHSTFGSVMCSLYSQLKPNDCIINVLQENVETLFGTVRDKVVVVSGGIGLLGLFALGGIASYKLYKRYQYRRLLGNTGGEFSYEEIGEPEARLAMLREQLNAIAKDEAVALLYKQLNELELEYQCPILRELMQNPVSLKCGHTFEAKAIMDARDVSPVCPCCRGSITGLSDFKINNDLTQQMNARLDEMELLVAQLGNYSQINDVMVDTPEELKMLKIS